MDMTEQEYWEYLRKNFSCAELPPGSKKCYESEWNLRAFDKIDIGPYKPKYGVGIITGPASGISVIDVDCIERFLPMAKKMGFDWEPYFRIRTASGKMHIHFAYSEKLFELCRYTKRVDWLMGSWGVELLLSGCNSVTMCTMPEGSYHIEKDGPVLNVLPKAMIEDLVDIIASKEISIIQNRNESPNPRSIERILLDTARSFPLNQKGERHTNLLKVTRIYALSYVGDYIADEEIFAEMVCAVSTLPEKYIRSQISGHIQNAIDVGIEPLNIFQRIEK